MNNPPDIPEDDHAQSSALVDGDADLLRAVTGDPTTYDLLARIIELLERVVANQEEALAVETPTIQPAHAPPRRYPPGQTPPYGGPGIAPQIWGQHHFYTTHVEAYDPSDNPFRPGNSVGLGEDNGCPI